MLGRADKVSRAVSLTDVTPVTWKNIKEKISLPQQVISLLEAPEMAPSFHWFYQCCGGNKMVVTMPVAEHLLPNQCRGPKHVTNVTGIKGPKTSLQTFTRWSKSWPAGSIHESFAIILNFPGCRQLTEQMSLQWLNALSCYLFNSDVENVSH